MAKLEPNEAKLNYFKCVWIKSGKFETKWTWVCPGSCVYCLIFISNHRINSKLCLHIFFYILKTSQQYNFILKILSRKLGSEHSESINFWKKSFTLEKIENVQAFHKCLYVYDTNVSILILKPKRISNLICGQCAVCTHLYSDERMAYTNWCAYGSGLSANVHQ